MYSCILIIIIIIFFLHLLPSWEGCPSPWACGAYPGLGMPTGDHIL